MRCGYNYLVFKFLSMEIIFKVESSSWINTFSDVNQLYQKKKKSGCVRELTLGSSGSHSKKRELQSIWVLKERMFSLNIALRFCKDAQHYSLLVKCKSNDTTMRYHLISVRMAAIKKSTNNKCWSGCGEKGTLLHCLWEWKPIHPLRRTVWRFLKKLGIE